MVRACCTAVVIGILAAGCGAPAEEQVARTLESFPHALAEGDGKRACEAFSPEGRARMDDRPGAFCARLRQSASHLTTEQRRRYAVAEAARISVQGDRATGYLRLGDDCVLAVSRSELRRSPAGKWRIERMGVLGPDPDLSRCLDS